VGDRSDGSAAGPRPEIDDDNRRFWELIDDGLLVVWRCDDCGRSFLPPLPGCPHCGSQANGPAEASGHGRLESWIVVHRAMAPEFAEEVPYVVGAIVLDEGARLFGRLLVAPDDVSLRDGLGVTFTPSPRGDHLMIAFTPDGAGG